MDGAHYRPPSPPAASTDAHTTPDLPLSLSPITTRSKRHSEPGTSRQRRLLQNRNAKFPAKKLSLSNLSNRFSQLIHANDDLCDKTPERDQENTLSRGRDIADDTKSHTPARSLGILDEISSSNRKSRQSGSFLIHQDTPERPPQQRSPFSSPADLRHSSDHFSPPVGFDHIQDTLGSMRLREISGNEHRGSPLTKSTLNGSLRGLKVRKPVQVKAGFDTEEYIEHLERELQEIRNEKYSPNTNKSLRDQLKGAQHENEKLQRDMADMQDIFENEVRKSIEGTAQMEVELKRQVRDLEEELECKSSMIRDWELQYEERRLDSHTINDLKAAIERLEQDKISLEEENRSMNKRNEVLSELLAMSPTKMQAFELRSPVREKRGGRPMSMIIPRLPSSPTGRQTSQTGSAAPSPALSAGGPFFSNWRSRPGSPKQDNVGLGVGNGEELNAIRLETTLGKHAYTEGYAPSNVRSRTSTLQSQSSLADTASVISESSPIDQTVQRLPHKRKPRKFMSGSTQLKPLLLPAITGESFPLSASSIPSSPMSTALNDISQDSIDPTTYFISQPIEDPLDDTTLHSTSIEIESGSEQHSESAAEPHRTFEEIMAEDEAALAADVVLDTCSEVASHSSALPPMSSVLQPQDVAEIDGSPTDGSQSTGQTQYSALETGVRPPIHNFRHCGHSTGRALQPLSYRVSLDMNALRRLDLPEANFDAIPRSHIGTDGEKFADVPRPLFSSHAHMGLPPSAANYAMEGTDRQLLHSEGLSPRRISDHSCIAIGEANSSQTSRVRSSWHASTDTKWTQLRRIATAESVSSRVSDLSQRSTLSKSEYITRTRSPLEILHSGKLGARPLASLTIRTIFGTIAQCTGHIRDLKRDPLALARRVIANAWLSNWKRFGKLSWWVLGLFISTGVGGPKLREWDWTKYDPEAIAQRACHEHREVTPSRECMPPSISGSDLSASLQGSESPIDTGANTKQKPGLGRSIMLWGKFSVAIMLAVGGAIVKGPGEMLKEIEGSGATENDRKGLPPDHSHSCQQQHRAESNEENRSHLIGHDSRSRDLRRRYANASTTIESVAPNDVFLRDSSDLSSTCYSRSEMLRNNVQTSTSSDEDATLRAVSGPRMRVADLFQRRGSCLSDWSLERNTRPPTSTPQRSSIDKDVNDGTVLWPPSPGRIYPRERSLSR